MQLSGELSSNKAAAVYSGPLDCAAKTWKFEGIRGVQRGLSAAVSSTRPRVQMPRFFEARSRAGAGG